ELGRCTSLRRVFAAGEALPPELAARFFDRLSAELHNLYGPTETAVYATAFACGRRKEETAAVPIGRPIANMAALVLDAHQNPVPSGVPGELYLGGVGVGVGYLNRPEMTAERFVPNPFADDPSARLYRTGDRVRQRGDGQLEYLGRLDHQVKVR